MKKNNQDQIIFIISHQIKKSSISLVEDLKYFKDISKNCPSESMATILGQLENVEQNIKKIRNVFLKKS